MARNYVGGDDVTFIKEDMCLVVMVYKDGKTVSGLEPRRLFPVTGGDTYITLLDADGNEKAIIRDIKTLAPESAEIIREALREYYLIPEITEVIEINEKFGGNKWTVRTEQGVQNFQIQNRHSDIKPFDDGKVLIRDTNDNRYVISDWTKLDKHSRHILNSQI